MADQRIPESHVCIFEITIRSFRNFDFFRYQPLHLQRNKIPEIVCPTNISNIFRKMHKHILNALQSIKRKNK